MRVVGCNTSVRNDRQIRRKDEVVESRNRITYKNLNIFLLIY